MTFIRKLIQGAEARNDEVLEHLENRAREIAANPAPNYGPAPQEPAPMIVRVAETYLKAHDNYTRAELDLTHRIDALVEERRQVRAAITSTVNGLYPIHDDPAIPDEIKKRMVATFNHADAVRVTLDDVDLT